MKNVLLSVIVLSLPLVATKDIVTPKLHADCENAMRLCAVCCAATSVWGGGMYAGGVLADTSILATDSVIHTGAGLMCGGLLGVLIGATCPWSKDTLKKRPFDATPMATAIPNYETIPQVIVLDEVS